MKVSFPGFELSTEHASSSYGQPVLIFNDVAYGPCDKVSGPILGEISAARLVRATEPSLGHTADSLEMARNFLDLASTGFGLSGQSYDNFPF